MMNFFITPPVKVTDMQSGHVCFAKIIGGRTQREASTQYKYAHRKYSGCRKQMLQWNSSLGEWENLCRLCLRHIVWCCFCIWCVAWHLNNVTNALKNIIISQLLLHCTSTGSETAGWLRVEDHVHVVDCSLTSSFFLQDGPAFKFGQN